MYAGRKRRDDKSAEVVQMTRGFKKREVGESMQGREEIRPRGGDNTTSKTVLERQSKMTNKEDGNTR